MKHWTLAALAAALSSSAFAQMPMHKHEMPMHKHERAGAAPAAEVTSVPKYESAFDGYRRHSDEKLQSWRGANDEAAAIGGHTGQWRGSAPAQAGEASTGSAPREATPMSPGMKHGAHHGMGDKK